MAANNWTAHQIRVAILGLNPTSRSLIPLFQLSGFKVTCVWDSNTEKAKEQCAKNGIPIEEMWGQYPVNWEDVLVSPNVDLVYIATSPSLHAEIAVKALAVGRHVVCENPPASSVEGVKRMVSMADYYPKLFGGLSSHFRFIPAVKKMKEAIAESNYCGRIVWVEARISADSLVAGGPYDWKCDTSVGGGALNILGSHMVDLLQYLCECRVVEVSAVLDTFHVQAPLISGFRNITSDDHCTLHLRCSNGVRGVVAVDCAFGRGFDLSIGINGEAGSLKLRNFDLLGYRGDDPTKEASLYKECLDGERMFLVNFEQSASSEYAKFFNLGCHGMLSWLHREVSATWSDSESSVKEAIVFDIQDCSTVSMATFEDGLKVQRILSAAHQSSCSRRWCPVARDKEEESLHTNEDPFWHSGRNGSHMSLENPNLLKPPSHILKRKKDSRKSHSQS